MAKKTLAVTYRPKDFNSIVEQNAVKSILQYQVETGTFKNAYLLCGTSGSGKTTSGRILANAINKGKGLPIEIDAASNSGVENVRNIIDGAHKRALDAEYKVYIIDEAHQLSNAAWNAFLKVLEDAPKYTIFIFCTTDPQKIPDTILSRVQRYNFTKISLEGIVNRLNWILQQEGITDYSKDSVDYIAKLSEGGMRTAISMMDKCLSIDDKLSLENVYKALGTVDYKVYFDFLMNLESLSYSTCISCIERVYNDGKDLKQFVKEFELFVLDVCKYQLVHDFQFIRIPNLPEYKQSLEDETYDEAIKVLDWCRDVNNAIKYDPNPRGVIEASILLYKGIAK